MPAKPRRAARRRARTRQAVANPSGLPAPPDRRRFRERLLAWYRRHGRDLPWRKTDDPYHILVSEIMLQQTQVDRVLPKYAEWLEKYPSLHALAAAPEREVTATWYPLGYNIRPRRLQTIAREAVARYGGQLPADEETLLSFKGIGAYTAGAIRSFAFRQRAAILDTNVARVLFRVFVGRRRSEEPRHEAPSVGHLRSARAGAPRVRFQPGADGFRRHGLRRAQSQMPGLPDDQELPRPTRSPGPPTPGPSRHASDNRRRRRGRHRTRRPLSRHAPSGRRASRGSAGSFPGGKCEPGESLRACLKRELREELGVERRSATSCSTTTHDYPDRRVELHFSAASCGRAGAAARPGDALGRRARSCATLEFPPADAELIRMLQRTGCAGLSDRAGLAAVGRTEAP